MSHAAVGRGRPPLILAALLLAAGCGGSGDAASTARAPSRAGDVWVVDQVSDRRAVAAQLQAFVNGLHVMVLDGNTAYAGMTRLEAAPAPDGGHALSLPAGLTARLVRWDDSASLRFSTGETIGLRRQPEERSR